MQILRLSDTSLPEAAAEAARVLRSGGIVIFPTDTLYGIAADALNTDAIARVRDLKGRERKKPIHVIVPSLAHMEQHVEVHSEAKRLADLHLPGALTLVLSAKGHVPPELTLNGTLGVRIPDDAFALALADAFERPFTATSANRAGHVTPTEAMDMVSHFGPEARYIDLIIDAGPRSGGTPSTVITFIDGVPYVLREGAIPRSELGL